MKSEVSLLILHQLPLEYYPPVTNLIDFLVDRGGFSIRVVSSSVPRGKSAYQCEGIRISRGVGVPLPRLAGISRLATFTLKSLEVIWKWSPDVILYYESHSSLPVLISQCLLPGKIPYFIHYHELYCPEDFVLRGHRMIRILGQMESKYLYPEASWISQTNVTRLEIFSRLHPSAKTSCLRTLPNYPPETWREIENTRWRDYEPGKPLRFVYVGALSFETTYLEEVCRWISRHPGFLSLDIFCQRTSEAVILFLEELGALNIRIEPQGIPYRELPDKLIDYHVGLVIYKGHTLNFIHNCPNKLYEYLACGLDTWYPVEMLGIEPLRREASFPKIVPIDFNDLDSIDPARLIERSGLSANPMTYHFSDSYEPLAGELEDSIITRQNIV